MHHFGRLVAPLGLSKRRLVGQFWQMVSLVRLYMHSVLYEHFMRLYEHSVYSVTCRTGDFKTLCKEICDTKEDSACCSYCVYCVAQFTTYCFALRCVSQFTTSRKIHSVSFWLISLFTISYLSSVQLFLLTALLTQTLYTSRRHFENDTSTWTIQAKLFKFRLEKLAHAPSWQCPFIKIYWNFYGF